MNTILSLKKVMLLQIFVMFKFWCKHCCYERYNKMQPQSPHPIFTVSEMLTVCLNSVFPLNYWCLGTLFYTRDIVTQLCLLPFLLLWFINPRFEKTTVEWKATFYAWYHMLMHTNPCILKETFWKSSFIIGIFSGLEWPLKKVMKQYVGACWRSSSPCSAPSILAYGWTETDQSIWRFPAYEEMC